MENSGNPRVFFDIKIGNDDGNISSTVFIKRNEAEAFQFCCSRDFELASFSSPNASFES